MEPPPLEISTEILFGIEDQQSTNKLLFLQYYLNNLNAFFEHEIRVVHSN